MRLRFLHRDILPWAFAAVLACALLAWTAFHVLGLPGGLGFSALLLLTLLAISYAAWRGRISAGDRLVNDRLADAINSLPHSIQIFDPDDRLVLINRHMHPDIKDIWRPRVTFTEVIRTAVERGLIREAIGREEEWIAERMERHRNPGGDIEQEYTDGRWVLISEYKTDDGGWIIIRSDITERKRTEEALRISEARFRNLVESTNIIPWEVDLSTWRFTYVGPHAERLTGYPAEDWYAENFWVDHIHDSDRERAVALCGEATARGEDHDFEYRMIAKDGRIVWLRDIVTVVLGDDGPESLRGFMVDITERKQAEEALQEGEARFRQLFENSPIGVWEEDYSEVKRIIDDLRGQGVEDFRGYFHEHPETLQEAVAAIRLLDVNPAAIAVYGATDREGFLRAADDPTVFASLASFYMEEMTRLAEGERRITVEHGSTRVDGAPVELRTTTNIADAFSDTWSHVVSTEEDITEQKQVEEALRISEARFRNLVESTNVIPWELDLSTWRFTYVGPHAERLTGYPAEDWYAENFWADHIHASDRERAVALCGEATARGEDHDLEYRMIAKDGRIIWLRDIVTVVLGDDGPESLRGFMVDITERKQAEEALRESEARLAHAHRLAKLGHWWLDVVENRLRASAEMATIFGVAEMYVTCDEFMEIVHPDDRHLDNLRYGAGVEFDEAYEVEYRIIRPDGELRHIQEIGEPYCDADGNVIGETGTVQDITERKLAEDSLRKMRDLLFKAQELGRIGSFVWDEVEDRGLYDSDVMREIFGYPPDEPLETMASLLERVHPDDRVMYKRKTDEALAKGVSANLEFRILLPNGETRHLHEISDPVFDDTGRLVRSVGMIQDITEHKRVEEALVAAKEQAESASRSKSEFLANMSHDLRTPLNAIIGFSDMMKTEMLGPIGVPKYREYVEAISDSGTHLLSMINDILDLSKIESASIRLNEDEVDVERSIDDVLTLLTLKAKSGGVELVKVNSQDLPLINADADRVKQILSNLLSNAVKFTPPGGTVKISTERGGNGGLMIIVSDTGIGISDEDILLVLEPFGQVDNVMTRKIQGTGLGLPLVRAMIHQHDGEFHIDSELGVGTTVTVTFPAERIL